MTMQFAQTALNLFVAGCLGAAIGFERQWRQRLAGLRTNTLVALGAAIFVTYSRIVFDNEGTARMAAQVVSGIGFLGAGVIFMEGLNVRGLNTAATLWCSVAITTPRISALQRMARSSTLPSTVRRQPSSATPLAGVSPSTKPTAG